MRGLRGPRDDTRQSFRAEVVHECEQVALQHVASDLVLGQERLQHDREAGVLTDERPDPRADVVETEYVPVARSSKTISPSS
jgi:hypothetical protein